MIFEELVAAGESGLQQLVDAQQIETLTLDFKAEAPQDPWVRDGKLTRPARRTIAQALSGFANSAGGILVLGVDARVGPDGIDCACGLHPFQNGSVFYSLVQGAVGELLQPRHEGIAVAYVDSESHPGAGYILINVARSDRRPHRSEATDNKQYYKRAGGSTFAMEHYDIEDAFRRSMTAELDVARSIVGVGTMGHAKGRLYQWQIGLWVINSGDASASFPSLLLEGALAKGIARPARVHHTWIGELNDLRISAGADFVVHPGEKRLFDHFDLRLCLTSGGDWVWADLEGEFDHIDIPYKIFSNNSRARSGVLSVAAREFPVRWPQ